MSVRRDPETGQFVSAGEAGGAYHDMTVLGGAVSTEIPAADLSGGTQGNLVAEQSDELEVADFGSVLDNDEVYELVAMQLIANLVPHTTFSAETWATLRGRIATDNTFQGVADDPWALNPTFEAGPDDEVGSVDIRGVRTASPETLWAFAMDSSGQYADSTNGLGGGGSYLHQRDFIPYRSIFGQGPVFDVDDELYAPHEYIVDQVSDGAVTGNVWVRFWGQVHQLD